MDWEILLKYLPMYEKAAWLTIQIGFMGVAGATVYGTGIDLCSDTV